MKYPVLLLLKAPAKKLSVKSTIVFFNMDLNSILTLVLITICGVIILFAFIYSCLILFLRRFHYINNMCGKKFEFNQKYLKFNTSQGRQNQY